MPIWLHPVDDNTLWIAKASLAAFATVLRSMFHLDIIGGWILVFTS